MIAAWADNIRSSIGKLESPKMPMANVVVQTMVMAHKKVATAVKTGRKRAAMKTSSGLSAAIASSEVQGWFGSSTMPEHKAAAIASASAPPASSRRVGGARANDASPIASGATLILPSASDVNQCSQMVAMGALEL